MPGTTVLVLAQLGPAAVPVPGLPGTPAWERYLLEQPWPAAGFLVVAGLVALLLLNRAGKAKAGLLGAAGAGVLAGVIALVAALITTDREHLRARTRVLVDSAAAADIAALRGMLDDTITFWLGQTGGSPVTISRDSLLQSVSDTLGGPYRLREHDTSAVQAVVDAPIVARTQVHVAARPRDPILYDVPIGSWWRIDWRREGDRPDGSWQATGLTLMQLDAVGSPERVRDYLRP